MATARNDLEHTATGASDNEEDPARRTRARVSRACARCRSRKDKCDGQQPQCHNCAGAGQTCLYLPASKKRGLPEGYVRGMEKLWAVMIQKIQGLDDTVERIMNDNQEELLHLWNHQRHGDDLHLGWKESKILAALEKVLSQLDQTSSSDLKRKRDAADNGHTQHSQTEPRAEPDQLSAQYQVTSLRPSPSHQSTVSQAEEPSAALEVDLPESAPNLLNHYFKYTHCWFPILNRPNTLRKLYEYRRSSRSTQPKSADLALLWAICAYSQQQVSRSSASEVLNQDMDATIQQMRRTARSLIPTETENLESGHIQAILLIVLLDMGTGSWTSAWLLIGLAVRMVLDRIESLESPGKVWLATLQGCFVLDTLIAVRLERPPHLQSGHLKRANFLDADGHEEWEPWQPGGNEATQSREPAFTISCFNRLTDLCMIVNFACLQQQPQPVTDQAVMEAHHVAQQFTFPIMTVEQRPPHQMLLQATYFAILVKICHATHESQTIPRWRFLETLEHFDNTWGQPEQCGIPSLLSTLCYLVGSKIQDSTEDPTAHTKGALCGRLYHVMLKLSKTWPDFKNASNSYMFSLSIMSDPRSLPHPDNQSVLRYDPRSGTNYVSQPGQAEVWPSQASLFDNDISTPGVNPNTVGRYANRVDHHVPLADSFGARPPFNQVPMDFSSINMDISEPSNRPLLGPALSQRASSTGGMATSPSFNGDEIDALFHEMAELDTTQWSLDRTQALKDFGFSDDTTFEAFCNDPDRLMLSDAYMGPFGQGAKGGNGFVNQSLLGGNPPTSIQQQGEFGPSYDIDIMGNSWTN
ncbi:hypothetical protein LTR84_009043 [Exophiala bonariae]|uniref:Zn(2)-C6 fungal-type domain-containing protein n=1 Tax=Exophiala bonariae TaxID=1690606 RepID=A0AAV9MVH9_9EURO|nr:hypothetical protein LTR84_009043 [Exophiala bonariae]